MIKGNKKFFFKKEKKGGIPINSNRQKKMYRMTFYFITNGTMLLFMEHFFIYFEKNIGNKI